MSGGLEQDSCNSESDACTLALFYLRAKNIWKHHKSCFEQIHCLNSCKRRWWRKHAIYQYIMIGSGLSGSIRLYSPSTAVPSTAAPSSCTQGALALLSHVEVASPSLTRTWLRLYCVSRTIAVYITNTFPGCLSASWNRFIFEWHCTSLYHSGSWPLSLIYTNVT